MLNAQQSVVVKKDNASFTPMPEGAYGAEVVDINFKPKEELKAGKFPPKDKYYITLGILDSGELRGKSLIHFVSTSFNAGFTGGSPSKLYDFVCAVMSEKVDDKKELDLNSLLGGQLVIIIKDNVAADGKVYSNITEVMKKGARVFAPLTDAERTACMPKIDGAPREDVDPDDVSVVDSLPKNMTDLGKVIADLKKDETPLEAVVKGAKK